MSRTVELAFQTADVADLCWPSVALTDGSPDPVRVAVPARGLDGVVELPLDGRAAARLQGLLRFRRFGFRVLMPAFWVVNTALVAAQVLTGLAGSQLDWRLGWVVLCFDVIVLVVTVVASGGTASDSCRACAATSWWCLRSTQPRPGHCGS